MILLQFRIILYIEFYIVFQKEQQKQYFKLQISGTAPGVPVSEPLKTFSYFVFAKYK